MYVQTWTLFICSERYKNPYKRVKYFAAPQTPFYRTILNYILVSLSSSTLSILHPWYKMKQKSVLLENNFYFFLTRPTCCILTFCSHHRRSFRCSACSLLMPCHRDSKKRHKSILWKIITLCEIFIKYQMTCYSCFCTYVDINVCRAAMYWNNKCEWNCVKIQIGWSWSVYTSSLILRNDEKLSCSLRCYYFGRLWHFWTEL